MCVFRLPFVEKVFPHTSHVVAFLSPEKYNRFIMYIAQLVNRIYKLWNLCLNPFTIVCVYFLFLNKFNLCILHMVISHFVEIR